MTGLQLKWGADEVIDFIRREFPQSPLKERGYQITELAPLHLVARLQPDRGLLRPGGAVSGPTLMEMVDFSIYALLMAHHGEPALHSVTTNLNISFLRRANGNDPLLCAIELIKPGRILSVADCRISQENSGKLIAHAEASYYMGQ